LDKYKAIRCWAEHMGGWDGDETDLNDETEGFQVTNKWVPRPILNEVLDEFETSPVYHMIDEV